MKQPGKLHPACSLRLMASILVSLLASLLASCNGASFSPAQTAVTSSPAAATRTPFQPLLPTTSGQATVENLPVEAVPATPAPAEAAPPLDSGVWLADYLPALLREHAAESGLSLTNDPAHASAYIDVSNENPATWWVYALVTPFSSTSQGVASQALRSAWAGDANEVFGGRPLLMDASTLGVFAAVWGTPADGAVKILASADLLAHTWENAPGWALVPFEALEPRWKVLEVDGQSPLRKNFDPLVYPLSVPITIRAAQPGAADSPAPSINLPSNRDPGRLTSVAMTGVTALVRATAFTMEQRGINYPSKDIREYLVNADITHISNEVPFARNCPFPNPVQEGVRFCSDSRYIELLEDVGTDVIELTGDHFHDYGEDAMLYTLELYRQRNWPYYGGGANLKEGRQPLIIEHNGNHLAFIGCNGKGGSFAQAGPNRAGSAACDMDWMVQEITRLRAEGYLPIATFQHFEYYTYQAQPPQQKDFRRVAEAGAVVVSGSQAHQPQAFEFSGQSMIHYGLGNLFFDQFDISLATRQAFIDLHIFYNGRYISTELLPMMFIDYARPRPMTPKERDQLLQAVFSASGW